MFPTRTLIQAFVRLPEDGSVQGSRPHVFEDFEAAVAAAPRDVAVPVVAHRVVAARFPLMAARPAAAR